MLLVQNGLGMILMEGLGRTFDNVSGIYFGEIKVGTPAFVNGSSGAFELVGGIFTGISLIVGNKPRQLIEGKR